MPLDSTNSAVFAQFSVKEISTLVYRYIDAIRPVSWQMFCEQTTLQRVVRDDPLTHQQASSANVDNT